MATPDRRHLRIAHSVDLQGDATPAPLAIGARGELVDADYLQVGDLAKATGKTVRAIHLYEDLGLIEPARRSKGHYRLFSQDAAMRVRWISKLQSLGLSLSEIQELVQRRETSESAMRAATELKEVYESKLREVKTKLKELKELETELQASLVYLDQCNVACDSDVAVHSCVSCSRHAEAPIKPDLVAGAEID